jgi:hypothetical protein
MFDTIPHSVSTSSMTDKYLLPTSFTIFPFSLLNCYIFRRYIIIVMTPKGYCWRQQTPATLLLKFCIALYFILNTTQICGLRCWCENYAVRIIKCRSQWPLACWHCGFESHRRHGFSLLRLLCVVRQRYLRLSDQSSSEALPTVVYRYVWSRNLVNEKTPGHWSLSRQNKLKNKNAVKWRCFTNALCS